MPSDDLVLNVKQVTAYPPVSVALSSDVLLLQRGGLGGPYQSISPIALVSTALISAPTAGPFQVGMFAPTDAVGAQAFLSEICLPSDGEILWNAYLSATAGIAQLGSGAAAGFNFDAGAGWRFYTGQSQPGATVPFATALTISPAGYVTLAPWQTVVLGRDPYLPLEAATMQFVTAQNQATVAWAQNANNQLLAMIAGQDQAIANYRNCSVWSFNGRVGNIALLLPDIEATFFAGQQPTSPMPPPGDASLAIATTAWVQNTMAVAGTFPTIEAVTVNGANALAPLSRAPTHMVFLAVNGRVFFNVGPDAAFSVNGNVITWTSTVYGVNPGDEVIAEYF